MPENETEKLIEKEQALIKNAMKQMAKLAKDMETRKNLIDYVTAAKEEQQKEKTKKAKTGPQSIEPEI